MYTRAINSYDKFGKNVSFCSTRAVTSFVKSQKLLKPECVSFDLFGKSLKGGNNNLLPGGVIAKITKYFNGDNLVGVRRINADGSYCGFRHFSNGLAIKYSTFRDKVGTTITKDGDKDFYVHVTGLAYHKNGSPNILTRKSVENLISKQEERFKGVLSPKEAAKALIEFFNK